MTQEMRQLITALVHTLKQQDESLSQVTIALDHLFFFPLSSLTTSSHFLKLLNHILKHSVIFIKFFKAMSLCSYIDTDKKRPSLMLQKVIEEHNNN